MFKTKLEKFIAKRVLIYCAILTIITLLLFKFTTIPYILTGLIVGGLFSILRLSSTASMYSKFLSPSANEFSNNKNKSIKNSIIHYTVSNFIAILLLIVSLKISQWLLMGMVAGILMVPFVVFVNSFTEALGITHNHFE